MGASSPQAILRQPTLEVHRERKNRPGSSSRCIQPGGIDSARWMKPSSPPPPPPSFRQQRFLPPSLECPCLTQTRGALSARRRVYSSQQRVRELHSCPSVETAGRVMVRIFQLQLARLCSLAERPEMAVSSGRTGEKGQCREGKNEQLSSSDALDPYIVRTVRRRGGGRRQYLLGHSAGHQTASGHAKPDAAGRRRGLNPNGGAAGNGGGGPNGNSPKNRKI